MTTNRLVRIINDKLDETFTSRTIQKDLESLRDDIKLGYLAPIGYDSRTREYCYTDPAYSITKFNIKENELKALKFYAGCLSLYNNYSIFTDFTSALHKVINGIDIKNKLFSENNPAVFIQTDTLSEVKGTEFLSIFVDAIVEKQYVSFTYQKYNGEGPSFKTLVPYFIKEYKNRWYLLGVTIDRDFLTTYALDRMSDVRLLDRKEKVPIAFNAEEYFKYSFGITTLLGEKVEKIVLHYIPTEAEYVRSLPIHHTQKTIRENRNGLTISIEIIPAYEFYEYLLSKTREVTVRSPKHIAAEVKKYLQKGISNYK